MPPLRARAPAKTNLFLEVLGRRPDGYHELDTVFAELDLADELSFEREDDRLEVTCEGDPTVPSGNENLVWRAAHALRTRVGRPALGARIAITKHVPSGGGLGGGSSDAATALLALDQLWELELGPRALAPIAAEVGSDCAFFLEGGIQRGTGRGELLWKLPPLARALDLVLLVPAASCPTPLVYKALAPHLQGASPRDSGEMLRALEANDPARVARALWNRLEAPCFELFPIVAKAKEDLSSRGLLGCLLSGSGATVLGVARDRAHAEAVASALSREGK
ncbi:4-(cytidine 5'-diphospho)-2-C-methyl-D-erythritol kinase, partial [bacterium]|nr:4-(cytidine 5'-diphospho)-2-C-methyl-D-erythritol kinase [bacterium]